MGSFHVEAIASRFLKKWLEPSDGCDETTDGLPNRPAQECVFFSRKAFKDLEDAIAQHNSNNEALKKAKDWPIQKAKQGEQVSATGSSGTSYIWCFFCIQSYVTPKTHGNSWLPQGSAPWPPWQEDWETLDASASKATKALEKTREEADKIDELKKEKDEEWGVPQKNARGQKWFDVYIPPKK